MSGLAIVSSALLSGCGLNPVRLSIPDPTLSEKISVTIDFTSTLNLPAGAKVAYEGDDIGVVRATTLARGVVAVDADIDGAASIPADCHAAIVQDTVLGDSYIRLTRPTSESAPDSAVPALTDGDRIPVTRTAPPISIEDTMSTLSSFIGTGSIQQATEALRKLNSSMPQSDAQLRAISANLAGNLRSLAEHGDELNQTVSEVYALSQVLRDRADRLDDLVSGDSLRFWDAVLTAMGSISVILPSVSSVFTNGYWLIPFFDSMSTVFEQTGVAAGGDPAAFREKVDDFVGNTLLPFMEYPQIDITDVRSADGVDRTADMEAILRNLRMVR